MDYRRTYQSAVDSFCDLVSRLPDESLDESGLGDWTLRDLVGHTTSSALRQVPSVLAASATTVSVDSPQGYWAYRRAVPAALYAEAVAASTRDAHATGQLLRHEGLGLVRDLADQAAKALSAVGDDDVVVTRVGGMRVRDWIPTRTFELVVHGLDASQAASVQIDIPAEAVTEALAMATGVAVALGEGAMVLRALTGRAGLSTGFSVI